MTSKQLLSANQVAEILDVSTSTLAKWRQDGDIDLPFLRINGRIRYQKSAVEQFIDDAESDEIEEIDADDPDLEIDEDESESVD